MNIEKYKRMAKEKGDENYRLRYFLRTRDEEEVDEIFREAHYEVFSKINCLECMNCCKVYTLDITNAEAESISDHIGIDVADLMDFCDYNEVENLYTISKTPCMFLKDNKCSIGECKPESCIEYPGTDHEGVVWRLFSILDRSLVCPAVYEILEYVKEYYRYMNEIRPLAYFFDEDENEDDIEEALNHSLRTVIDIEDVGLVEITVAENPEELSEVYKMKIAFEKRDKEDDFSVLDDYFIGLPREEKVLKILGLKSLIDNMDNYNNNLSVTGEKVSSKIKKRKLKNKRKIAKKSRRKGRK